MCADALPTSARPMSLVMHAAKFSRFSRRFLGDWRNLGGSLSSYTPFRCVASLLNFLHTHNKVFGNPIFGVVRPLVFLGPVLVKI